MNVIVYAVTLIAALFAFSVRPGPVSRVLLVAWCMSAVIGLRVDQLALFLIAINDARLAALEAA